MYFNEKYLRQFLTRFSQSDWFLEVVKIRIDTRSDK